MRSAKLAVTSSRACKTSTYYLRLTPAAGEKIEIRGLQTLIDATIIVAGNITTAGLQQEGLLIRLDNAGNTLLQKTLLINGQPCTLHAVGTLAQGDMIIAGTINNGLNQVFVARLAADLTITWLQQYTAPTSPLQVSMQLSENNRIALAIRITDAVICATINLSGTTLNSSQVSVPNLVDITGYNYSNSTMLLVCNVLETGNRFTRLVEMNVNTGALTAGAQMNNGTDETQYGAMTRFFGRTVLLGILKRPTGFSLIRNITYQSAGSETQHTYLAPANIDWNSTVGLDNTGRAMGVCVPQDGKLFFLRQPPDYTTSIEHSKSITVPIGAALKGVTACGDGGFLFGLNTSAGTEVILIKTDSIGATGCGYQKEVNQSNEKIQAPNKVMSFSASPQPVPLSASSGSLTDAFINASFDCNQNYCPFIPNLDDCFTSYYKKYASHSFYDGFTKYFLLNNTIQVTVTSRQDRYIGDAAVTSGGIKLFDEKGNFVKGVKVFSDGVATPVYANKMDEHQMMLQTYDGSSGKTIYTFSLLSDNLNMLWSKTMITNSNFSAGAGLVFGDMYKDQEGNFYFIQSVMGYGFTKAKVLVYKMDALGNDVWLKAYELPTGNGGPLTMAITNTSLIIIMEGDATTTIRLDKQTGNALNAYRLTKAVGFGSSLYTRLAKFDNGHIFYAGNDKNSHFLMATYDTTGKIEKMRIIDEQSSGYSAGDVKNGFMYAACHSLKGSAYSNVVIKIDTALDAVFKHEYPLDYGSPSGLSVADNGSIYLAGNSFGGSNSYYWDPYIIKLSSTGERGDCPYVEGTLPLLDLDPAPIPIIVTPYPVSFQTASKTITLAPDDDGQEVTAIPCNHLDVCSALQITGPNDICRIGSSYNYLADKDIDCKVLPQWTFDTAYATRIRNNTGELELQFKKTGSIWVEAKVDDGCHLITDRKLVQIQSDGSTLNLGNDSYLCPGDSLLLTAGTGFNSYKWQDGSTNTDFKVKQGGQYFVETDNKCAEHFYDTVNITAITVPPLDISGDTLVCYAGPALLTAPGQFQTYQWRSGSAQLSTNQTASFKLLQAQRVNLLATTKEGCKAEDSVLMEVKNARPVSLGADTSFCSGDSIILQAGANYASYLWNTGATAATIIAKQAATYIISALDTNNCTTNDTLTIQQLYSLPHVNLGADRNLCEGQSPVVLDAGQQSSYAWQDGSTSRYYTVNNIGLYKVSVTNSHGCISKDSINIKKIVPSPANFLTASDSLCSYASLELVPSGSYSNYLWSTGSLQPSITIDKPGVYILSVANKDGCSGSDTVQIYRKDCLAGVFIPNGFTPGNDGKNDVFRAMVYGIAINFELQVFNRYGQLVFTSKDPLKGWDGKVNGTPANSGTFVWQCRYQLKGDDPKYRKGIVELIR
ncbi:MULTISPECIES: gliding motility-associated C-terminal domain-containing protein [Niastella]|uniref:Gliding motility-associated C-terminal domain-containing protein n=1 Tax=Niastella soli TaxID=2821487 RepID=A0ABS3YYL9_9BACT|nr:gliding motility-associated C-terminal domain-containing protein [Niastella soli]MBO9203024.1 gliding motility-associated C-terminal domain-containing protein [Niastella soli]